MRFSRTSSVIAAGKCWVTMWLALRLGQQGNDTEQRYCPGFRA
jgi:hypothetical protein